MPPTTATLDIESLSRLWMQHMQAFSQPLVAFHQLAWRHHWLMWAPRAIIPSTIPVQRKVGVVHRMSPRSRASPHPWHVNASYTPIPQSSMCRINEAGQKAISRSLGEFGLQCPRPHQIKTPRTLIAIVVSPHRADRMQQSSTR